MTAEAKICQNCKNRFTIEPEDFAFYEKIKVPPPTWCPKCRMIRRLAWRNERNLYRRTCDFCKKEKIMMYPSGTAFPVYCKECWYSDNWDPKAYVRTFDVSRTFFEQFRDLLLVVPRCGIIQQGMSVESDYTNRVTDQRNCYLNFGSTRSEYCRYGSFLNDSKECVDSNHLVKCERCYWCIDCSGCYQTAFSHESQQCSDSWFLVNCRNCRNCFGCVNLRNKSYCIFNEQYTKETYEAKLKELGVGSRAAMPAIEGRMKELLKTAIVPHIISYKAADASGNWIEEAKNTKRSFACYKTENVAYCSSVFAEKDSMDHCFWGNGSELVYESVSVGIQSGSIRFCNESWIQDFDLEYSMNCHGSRHLFGCVGLRNTEYCILNKQYSKEEYFALREKIVEHMNAMPYISHVAGRMSKIEYRYGEFFPVEFSPHAYNETIAHEYFPLTPAETEEKGYRFRAPEARSYSITCFGEELPDTAREAPDSLTGEIIGCAHRGTCNDQCTTAFRILKEDLAFYRAAQLPLPILCPNCRHYERLKERNPLTLWPGKCQCAGGKSENGMYHNTAIMHPSHPKDVSCPNEFETSYAPDRPEIVYCESCYNSEVA